ncbi:hypothetical protein C0995_006027, partial [Termitomyces sp. Mi166
MITCLDEAGHQSSDPADFDFGPTTTQVSTGLPGCRHIDIDPELLNVALELCGPTHLASIFNCHPRTIRHHALEYGLVEPGHPVYVDYEAEDGTVSCIYQSSTTSGSDISDAELNEIVSYILTCFPTFGCHMIDGHLEHLGLNVVFIMYLDQISFGTMMDNMASQNNRATTVLQVFLDAIQVHGTPSHTHGDHGTENVLVSQYMEEMRGVERGSYIWGRSVHNIHIERLWHDLTLEFAAKWKMFFQSLEQYDSLDVNSNAHIWLLHFLFLDAINHDALQWANAWKKHVITIRGERQQSPKNMFVFGMIQQGVRGMEMFEDDNVNANSYGIDWEDYENPIYHNHHLSYNGSDHNIENPFQTHPPFHMSHIEVEEPT